MQETQLQQKEILAEKKENISKKSMHKKILALFLTAAMGLSLVACGGSTTGESSDAASDRNAD